MKISKSNNRIPRLFCPDPLRPGASVGLPGDHAHYLGRVLRLTAGAQLKLFNGDDGEFLCDIATISKKSCVAVPKEQTATPGKLPDLHYLFAPLKVGRLDYMAQKATEMGAAVLQPVITEFTQNRRIKHARLVANTIEAAEQCNLVAVPRTCQIQKLDDILQGWDKSRTLVFCDETALRLNPTKQLCALKGKPVALLVGPEGGFSPTEREMLRALPFVMPISIGPRILRADTAAVAALALLQSTLGDWYDENNDEGLDPR